jgi:hypothetical protein
MDTSIPAEGFTACIGLDWANAKHDVCVQAANSDRRESGKFQHTAAHIDQWAHEIHTRGGGIPARPFARKTSSADAEWHASTSRKSRQGAGRR